MTKKNQIIFSSLLGIVLLIVIFMPKRVSQPESLDEVDVTDSAEVEEIVYRYGIPMNDYDVDFGVVKRNQSLSVILGNHGLTGRQIHELSVRSKEIFDVRKIRSGQPYAFFSDRKSVV